MKKVAGMVLIIAILGFTIYLISRIPVSHSPRSLAVKIDNQGLASEVTEEWMGIFVQGQRVGHSFTKIAKRAAGLTVENHTQMTLMMMQEVRSITSNFFGCTDTNYTLKDFSLEIMTAGHSTRIQGKIEDRRLTLTSYTQGTSQTKTITLKEKPFFPDAIESVIKKKNLKPGDEITIPYFDPTTQSSASALIKVHNQELVKIFEKERTGTKVELNFMGIVSYLWLDENYRVIKEATPSWGMEMIPLTKEEALAEIKPADAFDLLSFFSVKVKPAIPVAEEISYIRLALKDISIEGLDLNDDFQSLISKEPLIIESNLAQIDELPVLKIPIQDQEEFKEPSIYIQSGHPDIVAEAKRMAGKETDAVAVVKKLVNGVYLLLKKNPTPSLPSALDVLKTKEGDCNEHSVLFVSLCRALGIPAKIYVGLVNLYGDAYFYHAWCAVWLGKWVPVDPTFNQFPADVRHLKLKEGEISDWTNVMKVVGRLKIEVLEYR